MDFIHQHLANAKGILKADSGFPRLYHGRSIPVMARSIPVLVIVCLSYPSFRGLELSTFVKLVSTRSV